MWKSHERLGWSVNKRAAWGEPVSLLLQRERGGSAGSTPTPPPPSHSQSHSLYLLSERVRWTAAPLHLRPHRMGKWRWATFWFRSFSSLSLGLLQPRWVVIRVAWYDGIYREGWGAHVKFEDNMMHVKGHHNKVRHLLSVSGHVHTQEAQVRYLRFIRDSREAALTSQWSLSPTMDLKILLMLKKTTTTKQTKKNNKPICFVSPHMC